MPWALGWATDSHRTKRCVASNETNNPLLTSEPTSFTLRTLPDIPATAVLPRLTIYDSPNARSMVETAESPRETSKPVEGNMRAYTSAVERFRNSIIHFIQHLDYLAQARDAYEKAVTASAKLRAALEAGDETLQILMTNMERALGVSISKAAPDEKESDTAERESSQPVGEGAAKKRFL